MAPVLTHHCYTCTHYICSGFEDLWRWAIDDLLLAIPEQTFDAISTPWNAAVIPTPPQFHTYATFKPPTIKIHTLSQAFVSISVGGGPREGYSVGI